MRERGRPKIEASRERRVVKEIQQLIQAEVSGLRCQFYRAHFSYADTGFILVGRAFVYKIVNLVRQ